MTPEEFVAWIKGYMEGAGCMRRPINQMKRQDMVQLLCKIKNALPDVVFTATVVPVVSGHLEDAVKYMKSGNTKGEVYEGD